MSAQQSRKQYVSHSVLNDRYPHGRVEKITDNGVWLEGQDKWWHFDPRYMGNQVLPKVGAYVVLTEDENHRITHIATQHELQQPSETATEQSDVTWLSSEEANARLEQLNTTQPNIGVADVERLQAATEQLNTALDTIGNADSLVDYRLRTDALALAVQLLNLEAHYGIDRDDIYRVAREVIRWIQARGEE